MPDLHHMLLDSDLDFLSRIARFWGVDLPMNSFQEALEALSSSLKDRELAQEVIQALPEEAQPAWRAVLEAGRIPSAQFMRRYGEIRILGEGWRKREEPDLHPISPSEMLWYRGLIGKGFLDSGGELQEFVYVPDEFLNLFSVSGQEKGAFDLRPTADGEHALTIPAGSSLVDRLATLLAELRKEPFHAPLQKVPLPARMAFELAILKSAGLVKPDNGIEPEKARQVLEKTPGEILLYFFNEWQGSIEINDLRMLPGLTFEGTWSNPVKPPRKLMLEILQGLNAGNWYSINALIAEIKSRKPDFQRSAGDYDSWFIRRTSDGQYLRGFDAWDEVEGYLLRYLIHGPLHWLGVLDLGSTSRGKAAGSFKPSKLASRLLAGIAPEIPTTPAAGIKTTSDGQLILPAGIQAALHYQAARFGRLDKETTQSTVYSMTHDSLENAISQGLKPSQLIGLLKRAGVTNIPPGFSQLLERYEKFGVEARLARTTLLTTAQPDLLEALQKDPRAAKCLGEVISPLAATVKPGYEETLEKLLAEMGRLAEIRLDV
jgi:hypothetical protein